MTKLKLAVIGAGHLGRIHARLLAGNAEAELVAVADPLAQARESVAAECKTEAVADYRQLVERVDAAVIATPTRLHHQVALDFLRYGVHLLVEKPLAATVDEADELVETARRHGATLQVGHVERFNPALAAAMPYLESPRLIEAERSGPFSFRSTDIGVVLDLMIHDLDVALALVGAPVVSVEAVGIAVLGEHEDVAQARLEFATGCVAQLSASRVSTTPKRQMSVWSDRVFAAVDYGNHAASVVRPSDTIRRGVLDLESMTAEEKILLQAEFFQKHLPTKQLCVESRNAIADEHHDFLHSIRAGRSPRVGGEQGRDVLALAERIMRAMQAHTAKRSRMEAQDSVPNASPALAGPHWSRTPSAVPVRREAR